MSFGARELLILLAVATLLLCGWLLANHPRLRYGVGLAVILVFAGGIHPDGSLSFSLEGILLAAGWTLLECFNPHKQARR